MFNYDPMTEEEAMRERYQLLPDGEYAAVIKQAVAKTSNSGNPMIEIDLDVYDNHGAAKNVRDYLVFSKNMMWKSIHCADSAGLSKEYEEKKFCPELLVGKNVVVKINSQEGNEIPEDKLKGKPKGSRYPDKNVVEDYVKRENQSSAAPSEPGLNDDIPF